MPSSTRCGSVSRKCRSLKVPGSPSSALTAIRRGPGSPSTERHLRAVGKPAPPQPPQGLVAAIGLIGGEVLVFGNLGMMAVLGDRLGHRRHISMIDEVMPD